MCVCTSYSLLSYALILYVVVHNYNAQFEVPFRVVTDMNQATNTQQKVQWRKKTYRFLYISMWTSCLFLNSTIWLSHNICRYFFSSLNSIQQCISLYGCTTYTLYVIERFQIAFYNTFTQLSLFPFWFIWKCQLIKSSINWTTQNDLFKHIHALSYHSYSFAHLNRHSLNKCTNFYFIFDCNRDWTVGSSVVKKIVNLLYMKFPFETLEKKAIHK